MSTGRATFPAGPASAFFHVLVRKTLLRSANVFNLTEADVLKQFVEPWQQGDRVLLDGRAWGPTDCKLTIYEGPRLSTQQRSLGLGWSNAVKFGENVTHEMLMRHHAEEEPHLRAQTPGDHQLRQRLRLTLWGRLDHLPTSLAVIADVITIVTAVFGVGKLFGVW